MTRDAFKVAYLDEFGAIVEMRNLSTNPSCCVAARLSKTQLEFYLRRSSI